MKHTWLLLVLFTANSLYSQLYEVGGFVGGANLISDVGAMDYLAPTTPVFGGVFKWNKGLRYAWRMNISYANLEANDKDSNMPSRILRGYRVSNSLLEFTGGLEINFVKFNLHRIGTAFSPYIFSGFSFFRHNNQYYYKTLGKFVSINHAFDKAIPLILGVKFRPGQNMIVGVEVGTRYALTDNLDGSNPVGTNFEDKSFGNVNSDDWYVFSGMTITYTFGRKPCKECYN